MRDLDPLARPRQRDEAELAPGPIVLGIGCAVDDELGNDQAGLPTWAASPRSNNALYPHGQIRGGAAPTSAQVYRGGTGEAGSPVGDIDLPDRDNDSDDRDAIGDTLADQIQANPAGFFVLIKTAPAGAGEAEIDALQKSAMLAERMAALRAAAGPRRASAKGKKPRG